MHRKRTRTDGAAALHDAAVDYAAAGWQVFPLSTRGGRKAPLFPSPHDGPGHGCHGQCGRLGHGFYDATSDPDTVSQWWTRHPNAVIGGRIAHHLLVLDVDRHGGGEDTLQFFEAAYHPLPATLTCYSGRGDGGRHLYWLRPPTPGWRLSGAKLRPGIDLIHHTLRYVVLPPSSHPKTGQPYWWDDPTVTPAEPPAWLAALVTPPRSQPVSTFTRTASNGVAALVGHVRRLSPEEGTGRHDTVLWALCEAYEAGAGEADIEAICQAAVSVGKPRHEVDAMRAWAAAKFVGGTP
ncbi:MAG TPA: bifunctional DNA primase/polymerase [Euzebyales bacterium]|nr:bifunctional DNA primase/polymerase [Euzebyales bacterium]